MIITINNVAVSLPTWPGRQGQTEPGLENSCCTIMYIKIYYKTFKTFYNTCKTLYHSNNIHIACSYLLISYTLLNFQTEQKE